MRVKWFPAVLIGFFFLEVSESGASTAPETAIAADAMSGLHGLSNDWAGFRSGLAAKGVDFEVQYFAEVWGNTTGGIRTGAVYTGLGQAALQLDFDKLVGWEGASFYTRWLWISGRDASEDLVGNMFTVSNIAGFNTFRNIELWLQQNFWEDKFSLRAGQLAADSEFMISEYGSLFINGTFGWPAFIYMNVPNGGPGYPMGAPGIRLAIEPVEGLTFLAAVFQGDVFEQNVNRHGFRWRLDADQGFLWLSELQWAVNQEPDSNQLPGTYKAGAWFDSGDIPSPDNEKMYWGDYGVYFVIDQMLYREPLDGAASLSKARAAEPASPQNQGLGSFARFAFSPADRNFLGFYFDAGLTYQGLVPTRDNDQLGIALGYGQLSGPAANQLRTDGGKDPGYELVLEITYAAEITPWLAIQPDIQFILHPGGDRSLNNALVVGGRMTVTF